MDYFQLTPVGVIPVYNFPDEQTANYYMYINSSL